MDEGSNGGLFEGVKKKRTVDHCVTSYILESVQPGAPPPVIAAEAFLLWEEDEAGMVLDLAEWGEEILQLHLGALLRGSVWHHVRLQFQLTVVGLDNDDLEEMCWYRHFSISQNIIALDSFVVVTGDRKEQRSRTDVDALVFSDQFLSNVAFKIEPWAAVESRQLWDDVCHGETFAEGLAVEWVILWLGQQTHLVIRVAVIPGICAMVAVNTAVRGEFGPVFVLIACALVSFHLHSPVTGIILEKLIILEMFVDPVGNSVPRVIRDDKVFKSQRFATSSGLRKTNLLLYDITNIFWLFSTLIGFY